MSTELKHLLIILGGIAVILILVILLFGGKSPLMRFLNLFLEETDAGGRAPSRQNIQRGSAPDPNEPVQKKTSEPLVIMATLIQKCDDRLRVIESSGQVKLIDEYYELIFVTRKGQKLKVQCSRDAYEKVPFNQQGSLTYKRNTLVKFKFYEDTIYND